MVQSKSWPLQLNPHVLVALPNLRPANQKWKTPVELEKPTLLTQGTEMLIKPLKTPAHQTVIKSNILTIQDNLITGDKFKITDTTQFNQTRNTPLIKRILLKTLQIKQRAVDLNRGI